MLTTRLKRLISLSARKPLHIVAIAVLLAIAALFHVMTSFEMTTDTGELISAKTAWRQNEEKVSSAFPKLIDAIVVVVDGKTPELAAGSAAKLAAALSDDKRNFTSVARPDANDYFARQGLLFGSVDDVKATTAKLIAAQPLLGGLAYDPSLHGVANTIATAAGGAADEATSEPGNTTTADLRVPLERLDQAVSMSLAGKPAMFSWQQLFAAGKGSLAPPTRSVLQAYPKLDFGSLKPGEDAVDAIHAKAAALQLDAAHGVSVGVTGEVPLADEEFGTIEDSMGPIGAIMGVAMILTLWFATRSARTVLAILVTIVVGLVITTATGLLAAGRLNLISVAFIPLYVGLGVDFGIQVSVRFNAERRAGAGLVEALERAADAVGASILLAAAAIVLALAAFLPTDYIGVAELGVIAGLGMIVALALNVTLLPALLVLLKPAPPAAEVGFARAAPVDRWLERNRKPVLWAFVVAMLASIAVLPLVKFDFNPLHLRNPGTPAMRQLADLMKDPERTPNTLSVLAPNDAAAQALANRLGKLPEVREAITVDSFVPDDQPAKLALIEDAALLLDPAINPFDLAPPSDDAATVAALGKAAGELHRLQAAQPGPLGTAAGKLAGTFTQLAQASPAARAKVGALLTEPLNVTLNQIRLSLQPTAVTRETLPADVTRDWLAKDGRSMIQITPAGNSTDNTVIERFTAAVRKVAPDAVGMPVSTQEAAWTVTRAFIEAGIIALVLVSLLLFAVLRSVREVAFTLAPVVLSGFLTLGSCVVIGQPLNFANIIAFPLLFGVGVAFHIYFVMAWRAGTGDLLQTSLARAIVFSALATGSAFGALWISDHPGTASMGLILMISLIWTLVCALIFEPALLGRPDSTKNMR
ncbi:MAG: hopanoid biosynthesis-associated transporter HpnN [Novosphingobium sp.]|nr:hopanoid biosynthesis-associated transporter HpnN [Novosphingobium sp.]